MTASTEKDTCCEMSAVIYFYLHVFLHSPLSQFLRLFQNMVKISDLKMIGVFNPHL